MEEESEVESDEEDMDAESTRKLDEKLRKDLNVLREEKSVNLKEKNVLEMELKTLRKTREDQDKKQKDIESRLEETEKANSQFEREKMRKLNEIQLHIMLRLDQIKNLEDTQRGGTFSVKDLDKNLPPTKCTIMNNISDCVLFTKRQLKTLANRETELKDEYTKIYNRIDRLTQEYREKNAKVIQESKFKKKNDEK